MSDEFELRHEPRILRQVTTCKNPGDSHAVHRQLTGLVHFSCNCGYSSGWVPGEDMPLPSEFFDEHLRETA